MFNNGDNMNIVNQTDTRATVLYKGSYYIVSESRRIGLETLIFKGTSDGKITDYSECGGGYDLTLNEVLANFDTMLHTF
jgi:hypothetical protein